MCVWLEIKMSVEPALPPNGTGSTHCLKSSYDDLNSLYEILRFLSFTEERIYYYSYFGG